MFVYRFNNNIRGNNTNEKVNICGWSRAQNVGNEETYMALAIGSLIKNAMKIYSSVHNKRNSQLFQILHIYYL